MKVDSTHADPLTKILMLSLVVLGMYAVFSRLWACEDAYIKMDGKKTSLVRGEAYLLRKDQEKERLEEGEVSTG